MPALVLCTSTRHTGVHLLAQADTQEFYSSHMHFPKHQTHRSSTPRTCIYVHVCISLLCTHSFFRDVYSCLSLRWATARLGHPLKAKGKDWVERNPDDRLSIDLTSAEAAERATPPINHFERALHMASCLGLNPNMQPPAYPLPTTAPTGFRFSQPGTGFPPAGAGRGIVVTPPGVFGRGIMPFGNTTPAAASSFSMLQQDILIGGLLHSQETMQAEVNDIRNLAGRLREQLGRFPI